jgi:hypothetical protein
MPASRFDGTTNYLTAPFAGMPLIPAWAVTPPAVPSVPTWVVPTAATASSRKVPPPAATQTMPVVAPSTKIDSTGLPQLGEIVDGAPPPGPSSAGNPVRLTGSVSAGSVDFDMGERLDNLMQSSLAITPGSSDLDRAVDRYQTKASRSRYNVKDLGLNYLGLPRGFDFSMEGARLVLDDNIKIKGLESAVYARQSRIDALHAQIATDILQMGLGLGTFDEARGQAIVNKAFDDLRTLAGSAEACKTLQTVAKWRLHASVPNRVFAQPRWDVAEYKQRLEKAQSLAMQGDPEMAIVKSKLQKYENRSKAVQVTGKVVEGTVSAITVAGLGIGVALGAQAAGATWGMANGGSEEKKLLKELYYEKRLESRRKAVSEEAALALMHYQYALDNHNVPLLLCCESLLAQLVGTSGITQILDQPALVHNALISRQIDSSVTDPH